MTRKHIMTTSVGGDEAPQPERSQHDPCAALDIDYDVDLDRVVPEVTKKNLFGFSSNVASDKLTRKAADIVKDIMAACQHTGIQYSDRQFPPSTCKMTQDKKSDVEKAVHHWSRPEDIPNTGPEANMLWCLFGQPPGGVILQGDLGKCWIVAVMSLLNRYAYLFHKLFITKQANKEGVYAIKLNVEGRWLEVIIDDMMACRKDGSISCTHMKEKQLWVPLLEKAMAKCFGGYDTLMLGSPSESMTMLTGYACEDILLEDLDKYHKMEPYNLMAKIRESLDKIFLVVVKTGHEVAPNGFPYESLQLDSDYCYTVVQIQDFGGNRLLQLRSHLHKKVWNGLWGEDDDCWSHVLRKKFQSLDIGGSQDGTFWMDIHSCVESFVSLHICHVNAGWDETRISGNYFPMAGDESFNVTVLELMNRTEVDISVHPKPIRGTDLKPIDVILMVFDSKWRLVAFSKHRHSTHSACFCTLEPDTYNIVCCSFQFWNSPCEKARLRHSIVIHSSRPIKVSQDEMGVEIIPKCLIKLVKANGESSQSDSDGTMFTYTMRYDLTGWIIVGDNIHPSRFYGIAFIMRSCQGLLFTRDPEGSDVLPPRSSQVLHIATNDPASCDVFWNPDKDSDSICVRQAWHKDHSPELLDSEKVLHKTIAHTGSY